MSALSSICAALLPGKGRRRSSRVGARYVRGLRPVEALVKDTAYCPAEQRDTVHAFLRMGGRVCLTCRHLTMHGPLTSTPPQDGGQ
ncbi:hypothetical protein [Streptomyces asoensis]|uniref:Transposase n=1 Tax=Streptomyces asoensis TaxID=249586 RepID=A0ABQ3RYV4_9ACTN|nr:hypothetical protein [Streptomyces asoensis]GGQ48586.1 hypothetical protein GCM10010496_08530 [Streptomyces asoensis]GHI61045.1 hypothetical protein Saso_26950 [Streptomyces asoensis]